MKSYIHGKIFHVYELKDSNIFKMLIIANLIYKFNKITIKISASYFIDMEKLIITFTWKSTRSRIANKILKKKKKFEALHYLT